MILLAASPSSNETPETSARDRRFRFRERLARDRRVKEHADRAEEAINLAQESIKEIRRELGFPLSRGVRIEDDNEPASVDGTQ